ncbi:MAG: DNA helicase RecQ [Flavobacteriaceae bacterium]
MKQALKDYFGYDNFRPLQEEIIEHVLEGKDNLVIMPTGGGKSICYQLPAILLPGLTLVISPLIALMKDQVDGLNANGVNAAYLNSSLEDADVEELFHSLENRELKLLYLAPESLSFFERIKELISISLVAIDEAHCISSWGHDFRPAYTQLSFLRKNLPETPIIALTATADKATREDILEQLGIPGAIRHIASFDRPNLSLEVRVGQDRMGQIESFLDARPDTSGIIYCLSRKSTEQVASRLIKKGINAAAYHAGLEHSKRAQVQEDFIYDRLQVVCATIAFGMGIDKSNVRWVIHYNLPKNIEGYYQEIGRAGRDGVDSETVLFYSYADVVQLQKFALNSGNEEVQRSKLQRMQEYTEATSCRRKILLNYFGEWITEDCMNCDVCLNPPEFFNGTLIAQKVLSGVYRLNQKESVGTLVDFLRGARNSLILDRAYDQLKTYGVASDLPWNDLQQYVIQLINQGYLEVAFHQNNALLLTELAKKVLFEGTEVKLTKAKMRLKKETSTKKKLAKSTGLFDRLRQLRLNIAQEKGIPAYLVFNDASLKQMESEKPISDEEFMHIDGVGKQKFRDYGAAFINEIQEFTQTKPKVKKKDTYKETLDWYQKGLSADEIAAERKLNVATIHSHFLKLFKDGEDIDLGNFVDNSELNLLRKAKEELGPKASLKAFYTHLEEELSYNTIKYGLLILERED